MFLSKTLFWKSNWTLYLLFDWRQKRDKRHDSYGGAGRSITHLGVEPPVLSWQVHISSEVCHVGKKCEETPAGVEVDEASWKKVDIERFIAEKFLQMPIDFK